MLKGDIVSRVLELMQDQSTAARALVNNWVMIVLGDIASRGYLKSLQREETTALREGSGTDMNTGRNYDLAPDTDKVFKVFLPSAGEDGILKKKDNEDFLKQMLHDGVLVKSQPCYYTIFGALTLRIHPVPSAEWAPASPTNIQKLHIWKYKDITALAETEDITEITFKATNMLMLGAYAFGARFDSFADYPATMEQYEKAVARYFFQQSVDFDRAPQVKYRDL